MNKYVALLRGIGPLNPNMRNEKLRGVFEALGYQHVQAVITTGNILFESPSKDIQALEAAVEQALPEKLGFSSTTIILGQAQFQAMVDHAPFAHDDTAKSELLVAFAKSKRIVDDRFESLSSKINHALVGAYEQAVFCRIDPEESKASEVMGWIDKTFEKQVTTRVWRTVIRIHKRFDAT